MKNIDFDKFLNSSKEDWREFVAKSLKDGHDITSLSTPITDGITFDPFVGFDEIGIVQPLDTPKSKSCITIPNSANANTQALEVLGMGVESLILCLKGSTDFNTIFDKIDLSIIDCFLLYEDNVAGEELENLQAYLVTHYAAPIPQVKILQTTENNGYNRIISTELDKRWDAIGKTLAQFKNEGKQCTIHIKCMDDLLTQISELRAIRKFWVDKNTESRADDLTIILDVSMDSVDDIHPLIPINYRVMSAYLGGADIINTYFGGDVDLVRLTINIHHIMREESHMSDVDDPMAGSFAVEQLTDKILKQWFD